MASRDNAWDSRHGLIESRSWRRRRVAMLEEGEWSVGFKLGEGNDGNGMFSKTRRGGRCRENCFSLKRRRQRKKARIISTFFRGLHTCDPAASCPSYFFHNHVCAFFYVCKSLRFSHSLCDWWVSVRSGSVPQPRPDQACSGHNNAINMWLTVVCVCECV